MMLHRLMGFILKRTKAMGHSFQNNNVWKLSKGAELRYEIARENL